MSEDASTGDERPEPEPAGRTPPARILEVVGFIILGIAVGRVVIQHFSTPPTPELRGTSPAKSNPIMPSNGDLTIDKPVDPVPKKPDPVRPPPPPPNDGTTTGSPSKAIDEEPKFPDIPAPPRGSELRKLKRTTITPSGANTPNHEP